MTQEKNPLLCHCLLLPNNNFEKQSELFIDHTGLLIYQPAKTNVLWKDCAYQHIYIVSKRAVREEEYGIDSRDNSVFKTTKGWQNHMSQFYSKIEFTNDPILIADGVPAITQKTVGKIIQDGSTIEIIFMQEFVDRYNGKKVKGVDIEKLARESYLNNGKVYKPKAENEFAYVQGFIAHHNQALQSTPTLQSGYSLENINTILDAYQVKCQLVYNEGTVPDARGWFYGEGKHYQTLIQPLAPKGMTIDKCKSDIACNRRYNWKSLIEYLIEVKSFDLIDKTVTEVCELYASQQSPNVADERKWSDEEVVDIYKGYKIYCENWKGDEQPFEYWVKNCYKKEPSQQAVGISVYVEMEYSGLPSQSPLKIRLNKNGQPVIHFDKPNL